MDHSAPETRDTDYPDPDLVGAYIYRKGVKTFHVADPKDKTSGLTACGLTLADLIDIGWARGARRRNLELCQKCGGLADLETTYEEDPGE